MTRKQIEAKYESAGKKFSAACSQSQELNQEYQKHLENREIYREKDILFLYPLLQKVIKAREKTADTLAQSL